MLVRVGPGQVRFVLPGLVADSRGVALGRDLLFRFTTFDRMVTFLRLLTAEGSFEDLAADLRVVLARAGQGGREVLVRIGQAAAHAIDAAIRAARAAQGHTYTGAGRHFVALRDTQSPLGYDVTGVSAAAGDLILYGQEGERAYRMEGDTPLDRLLLRLELRREHRGPEGLARTQLPAICFVTARYGLGAILVEYFHRAGVRAEAAVCSATGSGRTRTDDRYFLFRIQQPPPRLARLFSTTPGLSLYVPVTENVVVAAGFRHPVHLDACPSVFAGDRLVILSAPPLPPRFIEPAPHLVPIEDLVKLAPPTTVSVDVPSADRPDRPDVSLPIRLQPLAHSRMAASAVLVPWSRASWLRRLGFALPESVLARYRMAAIPDGLLILAAESIEGIPFGTLLGAAARGVLIPIGHGLRPAVSQEFLEQVLATADGSFVVFLRDGEPPVRIKAEALQPLERRLCARLDVLAAEMVGTEEVALRSKPPEIHFDRGVRMPLWGSR